MKAYDKLKKRVDRLKSFIDLNAPAIIIEFELALIKEAFEEYRSDSKDEQESSLKEFMKDLMEDK